MTSSSTPAPVPPSHRRVRCSPLSTATSKPACTTAQSRSSSGSTHPSSTYTSRTVYDASMASAVRLSFPAQALHRRALRTSRPPRRRERRRLQLGGPPRRRFTVLYSSERDRPGFSPQIEIERRAALALEWTGQDAFRGAPLREQSGTSMAASLGSRGEAALSQARGKAQLMLAITDADSACACEHAVGGCGHLDLEAGGQACP
ncbi:hypothetical protein BD413DRAFT_50 [Trametes elegans]|nr:hypothetical protein BD413DRAFT_50 [Trametes elegans]